MTNAQNAADNQAICSYECQACGWVYPPQSEVNNLETTEFTQLPDSFKCPLCGVDKSEFKPLQVASDVSNNSETDTKHQQKSDVVVIGAGLAGWTVVDALRAKDADMGVTLITTDKAGRYHKPMLSVAFSQNKTPDDLIRMTGDLAAEKANITLMAQTKVLSIDSQNKLLQTNKGEVGYGRLVMAMGASPAVPPCFAAEDIWHVNDIDNFAKIQQTLADASAQTKHIAVIGAGMVGTEIAEDLMKAGHRVTLLDMNDAPLAAMLPSVATQKISEALQAQGINFIGSSRVDSVSKVAEGGYQLHVTDCKKDTQQTLAVDHILISTGLKVSPELPNSAGVNFDAQSGIAVDEASLQTSVPNIYAIGDCMSIGGAPCRYVAPLRAQAATIAAHIVGQQQDDYEHTSYQHKPPMIRLKNKSILVSATGTPTADESKGQWQMVSDADTETSHDMVLEQVADNGEVVATVTLKMPK